MEPVVVFSVLIVLVGVTFLLWHLDKRRAAKARVEPPIGRHPVPEPTLRERMATFCREHPALDLHEEHGHMLVTWILPERHQEESPPPEKTASLEFRFGDGHTVAVFHGEGTVSWARDEDGHAYDPTVSWDWDLAPDFVHRLVPGEAMPDPNEHSPHTMAGLVHPLRRIVTEAGWAWQPVIEMPMEDRPPQRLGRSPSRAGAA